METLFTSTSDRRTTSERLRADRRELKAALRQRTPHATATWLLVGSNVAIYAAMARDGGRFDAFSTTTLLEWGALYGPRVADGEWWRLVTAMFLHVNALHLAFNMSALIIVGPIVERMAGWRAFAAFYIAAGLVGTSFSLQKHQLAGSVGASGAIMGLYGVLLLMMFERSAPAGETTRTNPIARPLLQVELQPCISVIGTTLVLGWWDPRADNAAHIGGLLAGCVCGWAAGRGIELSLPSLRVAVAALTMAFVCCAGSLALQRKVSDSRAELLDVFALDSRAMLQYSTLAKAKAEPEAAARVIDDDIVPAFGRARTRLDARAVAGAEHELVRAELRRYLQLRQRYWQLRAASLRGDATVDPELAHVDAAARISMRRLLEVR